MKFHRIYFSILFFCVQFSYAQFTSDALRLSSSGFGVSARSLGMGNSYTALANDYSSVFWNPAGLGQIQNSEISVNLSHFIFSDKSDYLTQKETFSNSTTNLNAVGFVFPLPTIRGSFVLALGYSQTTNFTTGLKFSGFNSNSSIIQDWAKDGDVFPLREDGYQSLAYQLWLANIDSVFNGTDWNYHFDSPIKKQLQQSGSILEDGGLDRWSISAAVEAAPQLFLGATLNIIRGKYGFIREYREEDTKGSYNLSPFDFEKLSIQETIEEDIGGFDMQLGMLYNFGNHGSFGIKLQTPTLISTEERFRTLRTVKFTTATPNRQAIETFDEPKLSKPAYQTNYDITSPLVMSVGAAYYIGELLLSGSAEFSDWKQLSFSDIPPDLKYLNTEIKDRFQSTLGFRGGAEYQVPKTVFSLRGGFMLLPSPYKGDPSTFSKKYITGGLGALLEDAVAIDIAYALGCWDSFTDAPNKGFTVLEKITTHTVYTTLTYRY